jgi:hypothetical protein
MWKLSLSLPGEYELSLSLPGEYELARAALATVRVQLQTALGSGSPPMSNIRELTISSAARRQLQTSIGQLSNRHPQND